MDNRKFLLDEIKPKDEISFDDSVLYISDKGSVLFCGDKVIKNPGKDITPKGFQITRIGYPGMDFYVNSLTEEEKKRYFERQNKLKDIRF